MADTVSTSNADETPTGPWPDEVAGCVLVQEIVVLPPAAQDSLSDDPEIAADYRDMTETGLRTGKAEDLAIVRATLPPDGGEVRLDDDQARAWLRTTNDLRLALGTRLGVTAETEPPDDPADEEGSQLAVYYWLTAVQGSLVDALAAGRDGRR